MDPPACSGFIRKVLDCLNCKTGRGTKHWQPRTRQVQRGQTVLQGQGPGGGLAGLVPRAARGVLSGGGLQNVEGEGTSYVEGGGPVVVHIDALPIAFGGNSSCI